MDYPGHIRIENEDRETIQSVWQHCESVAGYAGSSLQPAGMYHTGYLAGLWHDCGKAREEFSEYIEKAAKREKVKKGSVIHTFQGCQYIMKNYHKDNLKDGSKVLDDKDISAEIIAYAIGAHHGLFDCLVYGQTKHGFRYRTEMSDIGLEESSGYLLQMCGGKKRMDAFFSAAEEEQSLTFDKMQQMLESSAARRGQRGERNEEIEEKCSRELNFYLGMQARMVLSAVIEGDRRDTAHFMNDVQYPRYAGYEDNRKEFWKRYLKEVDQKLDEFPRDTLIEKARRDISLLCKKAASHKPGVYRLNVPTGAGKTLSSLRYALAHAAMYEKRRIIFTAPLLSIIDQNAQIIRDFLGDDEIVLEHHSNIADSFGSEKGEKGLHFSGNGNHITMPPDGGAEKIDRRELLAESWNAPVIITSMVQLLQTLFSGKTSCIRRFQALCGSVVVIDEVQSVPNKMLSLFNLAVNYLSEVCDVTFLLCSATQPYFEGTDYPLLRKPEELIPFREELWKPFRRTSIQTLPGRRLVEMPELVLEEAKKTHSLLVICNKKTEAEYLFKSVKDAGVNCFHLSASMCMAHRKEVLQKILQALNAARQTGKHVVCITTQVIEAGVDISFGRVIRFAAGMDSVVQAAGRCNRNGEDEGLSPVLVTECVDENLAKLKEIQIGKDATLALLVAFRNDPCRFGNDLSSEASICGYYRKLYESMREGYQDYSIDTINAKKRSSLLSMLSDNRECLSANREDFGKYMLNQAFAEAGALFQVFDQSSIDAVVPFGEGRKLIFELEKMHESRDVQFSRLSDWINRAKPYTVSLYSFQREAIEKNGGLHEMDGILVLHDNHYDEEIGVIYGPGAGDGFFL